MQAGSNSKAQPGPQTGQAALALVGLAAAIGQIALMREVVALFNGNELSLGVVLAVWMAWTALGSGFAGWILRHRPALQGESVLRIALASAECLCGLSLPLTVWALRAIRAHLQAVPGESLGPVPSFATCALGLSPFCVLSGCLYALAGHLLGRLQGISGSVASSRAYLLETAGSALGGIATGIVLLHFLNSLQIALVVVPIDLCVAACLLLRPRWRGAAALALGGAALAVPLLLVLAPRLDSDSQQRLWSGFQLLETRESIYGKLSVVEAGGMRSVYDNGSILANVPDPAAAEEAIHYALLEDPAPKRVLLIGGALGGGIAEALKHPTLERLDYVELDPALTELFRRRFPTDFARAFSDPRVHLHHGDGRLYLKSAASGGPERFDAILVGVPDPETAQWNRFYTVEFFRIARQRLAPGGVLALQLHSSEETIGPELGDFLRCIHRTLREAFPYVVVIPGETIHFFASDRAGALTDDPQELIARLRRRNLQTLYVREYFLPYRMSPERMEQERSLLRPLAGTPVNRDFRPVAYYFTAVLWSAQFRSRYARLLEAAAGIGFAPLFAGPVVLSLALVVAWRAARPARVRAAGMASAAATGYTLMTLQILLLLAFQSVYGYVYGELAILVGMFMAGIALGSWLGIRRVGDERKALAGVAALNQMLLAAAAPLLLLAVELLARASGEGTALALARFAFPALALLCGVPGGYQFPLASALALREGTARTGLATLYALDLLGGCVGALLLAGFLIPIHGFWRTAWLASAASLAPALLFALARSKLDGARSATS